MLARDYLNQFAIPNFYFHVVVAYPVILYNGVDVGKMDYIGQVTVADT